MFFKEYIHIKKKFKFSYFRRNNILDIRLRMVELYFDRQVNKRHPDVSLLFSSLKNRMFNIDNKR